MFRYLPRIDFAQDLEQPLQDHSNGLDDSITRIAGLNQIWKDGGLPASSDALIAELIVALDHASKLQTILELVDQVNARNAEGPDPVHS